MIRFDHIKSRAVGFPRIQIRMPYDQRSRVTNVKICQQLSQSHFLRLRACILRSLPVCSQTTDVTDSNRVRIVSSAMCAYRLLRPARLNRSVSRNHIVVATAFPAQRTVITIHIHHPEGTARPIGRAMHNDQRYCPHDHNRLETAPPAAPVSTNSITRIM